MATEYTEPIRLYPIFTARGRAIIRVPENFEWNESHTAEGLRIHNDLKEQNISDESYMSELKDRLQAYIFLTEKYNAWLTPNLDC